MSSHLPDPVEHASTHRRNRSNSKAQIQSAMHAVQQGRENIAAATGAFAPGTGGFIGGPPAADDANPPGAAGLHHRTSLRHKKDTTLYSLNGKRVRTTDRICNDVPPLANFVPSEPQFWSSKDPNHPKPSLSFLKSHFISEGRLSETQALYIINAATRLFQQEANMLTVGDGVTVCGDIHGQFYDLLKLFEIGGDPADTPYLFLGDYVDRGAFGIECLLYLYAHKIHYPGTFFLLRGNHECRHLTKYFTFANECIRKYSVKVYEACLASFNALPIAALMDERFLCLHGGLSPDLRTLADIQAIDRFKEPPTEGILCDILWSDPIDTFSRIPDPSDPPPRVRRYANRKGKGPARGNEDGEGDLLPPGFTHNHIRGCSFFYDYTAVTNFLERNRLISLIRGHEVQDTGYRMYRSTNLNFPALITVFSAPNYLDVHHNRAAVIKYITHNITIRQFNGQPHPYTLPGHLNAFTWSLPFVAAKITEMLLALLNIYSKEELEEEEEEDEEDESLDQQTREEQKKQRQEDIKSKILTVGRMARVFELLRSESEGASELAYSPPGALRNDARLGIQNQRLSRSVTSFEEARKLDLANERLPAPPDMYRARSGGGAGGGAGNSAGSAAGGSSGAQTLRSSSSSVSDHEYSSTPSFGSHRHRGSGEDTSAMIKRTLEGRDDAEDEQELLRLAARLSKPLFGKDVKRAYGAKVSGAPGSLRRLETA